MHGKKLVHTIKEVEAYGGSEDLASHARFGCTKRTAPMFGPPGTLYVYFTYGMHWMLNIVCEAEGIPSAVLIRGTDKIIGPARLTKALGIDGGLSGMMIGEESGLWIEYSDTPVLPTQTRKTPRIGVDYAGVWAQKCWRFVLC